MNNNYQTYFRLQKSSQIKKEINKLNNDRLYLLFIKYNFTIGNVIKNPLFLLTKIFSWFQKDIYIDHVCYITNIEYINKFSKQATIFEANVKKGMIENDLFNRLVDIDGSFWIRPLEFLSANDRIIEKEFKNEFKNKKYGFDGKIQAALSGIDGYVGNLLNNLFKKRLEKKVVFCSYITAILLDRLGYDLSNVCKDNNLKEITPTDLFYEDLKKK